jgi:hypothetical protein
MTRIAIVSVHYYGDYLARSCGAIARLAARAGADSVVAVANRHELLVGLAASTAAIRCGPVRCLEHDNTGLEFGAYQAGLDCVLDAEPDWVVFANDTFAVHNCFYGVYRKRLLAALSIPADAGLQVAGEVVSMPRSYTIGGARSHRWLTTSIFALNRSALRALHGRIYYPEVDALIRTSPERDLFFSDALDDVLVQHLAGWLFGVPGQGRWYAAGPLTEASAPRLACKARSILQEKHLSALLDHAGAWFIDLNPYGAREKISRRVERALFETRARLLGPARNASRFDDRKKGVER